MRALVTGATGFLGRPLVEALRSSGHDVTGFEGDVREAPSYADLRAFDVVFHLAARANVAESLQDPTGTWDVNVNGTLRLLEWARLGNARRVVLISSAQVYGPAQRSPIDESHPLRPVTPYGASKVAAEALVRSYSASYGFEHVLVRPFNMYGPGQTRGYVVPDVLHQIREGKALVLGDPRPIRDFTFVSDAAEMIARAGVEPKAAGRALNLGSGVGHAIGELVEIARKVSGTKLEPFFDEAKFRGAVELPELIVDARAARETLGWTPKVDLATGLRRTWEALARGGPG